MVEPSCPALVILDDDAFRSALIRTFDQKHFTVTFFSEGDYMDRLVDGERRAFQVIIVGVDLAKNKGTRVLDHLRERREKARCGIIIIGEPNPEIRTFAPWVDETLLRPVDPEYVASRARTYCVC